MRKGELEGRFDPAYNLALIRNQIFSCFQKQKIGSVCKSFSGGTPSKANQLFWTGDIPWVSPKDMKEFYLNDTIDHITAQAVEESSTTVAPAGSVLVVVRSGILQHTIPVAVTCRDMAINQDIKALIFKDCILPVYAAYFFDVYQSKLIPLLVKHSTTVQSINTAQFDRFEIPLPPLVIQSEIVSRMDAAYAAKKQKEAEAQRLLESIDGYLLGELGIELPEQEENTLHSRIFRRRFSEISGGRFDSNFFKPYYKLVFDLLSNINCMELGDIVRFSGENWNQKDLFESMFPYIEIGEIDLFFGEINNIHYLKINEAPNRAKMIVRANDIIVSTTRPSRGAIAKIIDTEEIFIASTGFSVIREFKISSVNRSYLFYVLKSKISLKQMEQRSSGGNYPAITQEELAKIKIPLPPLSVQTEIANRIAEIRSRAKQLQQEAKDGLEQAKREIETMILGHS